MHPVRQYGGIVRETFTHDKVINEKQAETFWNRSSMFSQFVSENKDLSIMYARPNIDHESYVEGDGSINSDGSVIVTRIIANYPPTVYIFK